MRAEVFVLFSEECLVDSRLSVNIRCRKAQVNELTDVNSHCYLQGYVRSVTDSCVFESPK